jgi:hypothetical protein
MLSCSSSYWWLCKLKPTKQTSWLLARGPNENIPRQFHYDILKILWHFIACTISSKFWPLHQIKVILKAFNWNLCKHEYISQIAFFFISLQHNHNSQGSKACFDGGFWQISNVYICLLRGKTCSPWLLLTSFFTWEPSWGCFQHLLGLLQLIE